MLRTVETKYGKIKGIRGNNARVTAYRGIPFAKPPVGDLRWRAPQPVEPWDGVREAYNYGPISMQDTPGLGDDVYCREWHVDPEIPMDEDCLYLNVWTPAKSADEKLPVLVWYFGGAFNWGYTAEMEFDGEMLANQGIVVVTVNYRIAVMGFLGHPDLTKEAPDAPTNFGLLDQKAGLDWTIENIAAFGGDPDNITIAGQSAGGGSVLNQLACKKNQGKMKRAAIFSGIIKMDDEQMDIFTPVDLKKHEQKGVEFFKFLGVSSIEEARKLDAKTVRDKYGEYAQLSTDPMKMGLRFFPCDDGVTFTGDPTDAFAKTEVNNVPLMTGYTTDEFVFDGINTVKASVDVTLNESFKNYPDRPLYYYCFGPEIPGWDNPGVFHSVDLWFWFETLGMCWRPFTGKHYDLARHMSGYFVNFIKTGDPNGKDHNGEELAKWSKYTGKADEVIKFD